MNDFKKKHIYPCPFCPNGQGELRKHSVGYNSIQYYVECNKCGSQGPKFIDGLMSLTTKSTQLKAVKTWNTRIEIDEKEIEEKKEKIDEKAIKEEELLATVRLYRNNPTAAAILLQNFTSKYGPVSNLVGDEIKAILGGKE